MIDFLSGAAAALSFVAALFFLRFWKKSHDAFFVNFAIAFALLGVGRIVQSCVGDLFEDSAVTYLPRLAAFVLIGAAIVRKNRGR